MIFWFGYSLVALGCMAYINRYTKAAGWLWLMATLVWTGVIIL